MNLKSILNNRTNVTNSLNKSSNRSKIFVATFCALAGISAIIYSNQKINKNFSNPDNDNYIEKIYYEHTYGEGSISRGYLHINKLETNYFGVKKTYIDGIDELSVYDNLYFLSTLEQVTVNLGKDSTTYYASDINIYSKRGQELKTMFELWNYEYNDLRMKYAKNHPELFPGLNNQNLPDDKQLHLVKNRNINL